MIDPTNEIIEILQQYFRRYYSDEISAVGTEDSEQERLCISFESLESFDPQLATDFRNQPQLQIEYAEEALRQLSDGEDELWAPIEVGVINTNDVIDIDSIRSRHLENLISVSGTVNKASEVRSEFVEVAYECQRCGTLSYVPSPAYEEASKPVQCQGCERNGPFKSNFKQSEIVDVQTIHIQQRHTGVGENDDQASLAIELIGALAGTVDPADTLTVTGVLHLEEENMRPDTTISDKVVEATGLTEASPYNLDITDDDEQTIQELAAQDDIRDQMVDSLAPSVFVDDRVKEVILLQLFSGVPKSLPDGTRIRGDIHVALIGDPGTAKSKLLRHAAQLAPRSVHASGNSSSSVGLTAATVPTKGGDSVWTFEAGALPMADQGVACLDDLDKFSSGEQGTLHGVLENQVVDVNKASVTASIPARTGVLAAGNPLYGRFDQYEPIGEQIDFNPGLVSQFDLLQIITDDVKSSEDKELADHILNANLAGEVDAVEGDVEARSVSEAAIDEAADAVDPAISTNLLQKYIVYARENVSPVMSDEASDIIQEYYVSVREKGADDAPVPITARKLDGLVRLAEASARLRLSETVEKEDAERITDLVQESLRDMGVDPETGQLDVDLVESDNSGSDGELNNVKKMVSRIEQKYEDGAPIVEVIAMGERYGMSEKEVSAELERLKNLGEVYEPKSDHLRAT